MFVQSGDQVFITNHLPYVVTLEEGRSKQAPADLVALSIEDVNVAMNKLVAEGLKDAGLYGGLRKRGPADMQKFSWLQW